MFSKITYSIPIAFGCFLTLFGSLGIVVGIIAIIDPIGSKMADDSDPLGIPPTFSESLILILVYVLIFILGISLILGFNRLTKRFSKLNLK
ncbi:MAG TPA: hypothetical protein VNI84_09965 [Pyrinomonadaceae bacterium]|nr:hypothetical protein [Pyrinomonadaceae bacterium]